MASEEILIVGGGLAGLSLAYHLSKKYTPILIESNSYFGGYFISDSYSVDGICGEELVSKYLSLLDKSGVNKTSLSTGVRVSDLIYVVSREKLFPWSKLAVAATGFRCKTLAELGIYGDRPAGVFCVNTVMEMLKDGYIPGEHPIIYGLNRYTISVINNLLNISAIKSLKIVSEGNELIPKKMQSFVREKGFTYVEGKITLISSYNRVSRVKLDNSKVIEGDSLIIGFLLPFNYLGLDYSVGNASMIIMNPLKITMLSELLAENLSKILEGEDTIKLDADLPVSPNIISRSFRKIMVGCRKGTKLRVNGKAIIVNEDYEIISVPDSNRIMIRVIE